MAADATKVLVLKYITTGLEGIKRATSVVKENINTLDKQRIAEQAAIASSTRGSTRKQDDRPTMINPATGRKILVSNAAKYGLEAPEPPKPTREPKIRVTPQTMAMSRGTQQAGLFGNAIDMVNVRMNALGPGINSVAYASSNMTRQMESYNRVSNKTDRAVRKIVAANMSLLGVMFSVMGVLNVISKLIGMVFSPLTNLDTMFQKLGLAMAFGGDMFKGALEGVKTENWVDGWMNLQGIISTIGVLFTDLAAKVFTDDKVLESISNGVNAFAESLRDPTVIDSLKNLAIAIADMAPAIAKVIPKIANLITAIVPFLPFLTNMGMIAMLLMPIISLFTVVIVGLNTAMLAFGYGKIILGWLGIAKQISRANMALKLFTVSQTGMKLGSFGTGTIIRTIGTTIVTGIGPAITGAISTIAVTLTSILSSITLPIVALVGMILAALRALWVLGDQIKEFGGLGKSVSNIRDTWTTGSEGLFNLTNIRGGVIATAGSFIGSERLEQTGRDIIINNDNNIYVANKNDSYDIELQRSKTRNRSLSI